MTTQPKRADATLGRIMALIFEGHSEPGARLPSERMLAARLKVSRTTLRDALATLEARGIVESRSKSGTFVRTAIPHEVRGPIEQIVQQQLVSLGQIIELRKVLECWAATKAAAQATRAQVAELRACLAQMRKAMALGSEEQFHRYRAADRRFHQVIGRMTGNPLYPHLFEFFFDLIGRSMVISREIFPGDFGRTNLERHVAIFDAIVAHDARGTHEAMTEHFAFVERWLVARSARRRPRRR